MVSVSGGSTVLLTIPWDPSDSVTGMFFYSFDSFHVFETQEKQDGGNIGLRLSLLCFPCRWVEKQLNSPTTREAKERKSLGLMLN